MRWAHLLAQQSSHTGLRGVADGGEVVTSLQGQDQATSGQGHQLPGQVAETWVRERRSGGRSGGRFDLLTLAGTASASEGRNGRRFNSHLDVRV